jgi:hypothetical protein
MAAEGEAGLAAEGETGVAAEAVGGEAGGGSIKGGSDGSRGSGEREDNRWGRDRNDSGRWHGGCTPTGNSSIRGSKGRNLTTTNVRCSSLNR